MVVFQRISYLTGKLFLNYLKEESVLFRGLHLPREKCKGKHRAVVARADVPLPEITQVLTKLTSHKCSGT